MKNDSEKVKIGPVQLIAIGFDEKAKFEGKILKELERLENNKSIRLLDLLFVKKDKDSDLIALSIQGEEMGAIVGALLGFEFEGEKQKSKKAAGNNESNAFGLTPKQIEEIGQSLKPGTAAGIMLIEHVWAKPLKQLIRRNGGYPIGEGFITPEAILGVASELEATTSVLDKFERESKGESAQNYRVTA